MKDLIKIRFLSFGYGALSLILMAVAGVLLSPEFSTLITDNFGGSFITGLLLLFIPELAKHIRNLAKTKKLGSKEKVLLI